MKSMFLVILFIVPVLGQTKTGTSLGQFLLIEPSSRAAAMGNAGSTLYGEVQAAYYNPAALGFQQRHQVQFTHSPWLAGITFDYVALAITFRNFGTLSGSVTSLNSGDIEVRTVDQPLGTGELYTVSDLAIGIGYGRQISDRFSVGLQVNFVQERIWHSSMSAFGLNFGTVYRLSENGLHIGASLSNFGTRGRFDGRDLRIQYDPDPTKHGNNSALPAKQNVEDFPLPIIFRVGLGYPIKLHEKSSLRIAIDAFHPSDNTESVSYGAEWDLDQTVFLRGGYQNLFLKDSEVGLTFGGGLRYERDSYTLTFDYAWADYGRLKDAHRFTVAVTF